MSHVLEKKQRLFHSVLWKKIHEYYNKNAHKAWADGQTPEFISTNAFIGDYYAKIVHRFLTDTQPTSTTYLLDIGSGSGRFAYHFLKAYDRYDPKRKFSLVYVACDFSQQNLTSLLEHDSFQPWIEKNQFDVAFFDASKALTSLELQNQKKTITQKDISSPLFAITNYLMSSLPIDQLEVTEDKVYIGESTFVMPSKEEKDYRKSRVLMEYSREMSSDDMPTATYFDRSLFPKNDEFPFRAKFPSAVFQLLEELRSFSNNKLALLCSDVAVYETEKADNPPAINFTLKTGNSWFPLELQTLNMWIEKTKGNIFYFEENPHFFTSLISYGIPPKTLPSVSGIKEDGRAWLTPAILSELLYVDDLHIAGLLVAMDQLLLDPLILIRKQHSIEVFLLENCYFAKEFSKLLHKHHHEVFLSKSHKNNTFKVLGDLFYRVDSYDECIHYLEKAKLKFTDVSCCIRLYLSYKYTGRNEDCKRFRKKYILSQLFRPIYTAKFFWDSRSAFLNNSKICLGLLLVTGLIVHFAWPK